MAVDVGASRAELIGGSPLAADATGSSAEVDENTGEHCGDAQESVAAESIATDAAPEDGEMGRKAPLFSGVRGVLFAGVIALLLAGVLTGWLGWRTYQSEQTERLHNIFLQAASQGALNLTTIDFAHADADIQRVLDGSMGTFYDDFQQRAAAFEDVVKKTQSKTEGTVTSAGIESISGDSARVLVAVSVKTSNLAAPQQHPRLWRMRIDVQRVGDRAKVTNVGFVA